METLLKLYPTLRLGGLFAALRALAITALLAVWALSALPSRPLSERALHSPRHALARESARSLLIALHIDTDADAADRRILRVNERAVALRNRLYAPFEPVFDAFEMGQRWGLFLQGNREVFRLQVETANRDGEFKVMYLARQLDQLGLDDLLAYRRLRGIDNPNAKRGVRAEYEGFVSFVAARVFAQRASVQAVRVSVQRYRLPTRERPMRLLGTEFAGTRSRVST